VEVESLRKDLQTERECGLVSISANVVPLNSGAFETNDSETRDQALERLYNAHLTDLRAFLQARTGLGEELDDIIQDVFTRLAKLDDLQQRLPPGDQRNLSYLFSMAHNRVVDLERNKSMRRGHLDTYQKEQDIQAPQPQTPEQAVQAKQELERLKQVILGLKPKCRQAFMLNRFKFHTYREIAVKMGISVKQVEKYMKQALIKVRETAHEEQGT
jgi:RNA polymerase sigma-19 factor, ECF subfamily